MKFKYQARSKTGEFGKGVVTAPNQEKAEQLLSDNGLVIISLEEQSESILDKLDFLNNRVGNKDLVLFSMSIKIVFSSEPAPSSSSIYCASKCILSSVS